MRDLSDILLEERVITKKQLKRALIRQEEKGGLLGMVLLSLGYISADTLMKYISIDDEIPLDM